MRRHVKASPAGSIVPSGKRRLLGLLATVAIALCVLGSGASSASAALTTTMGTVSNPLSGSAHVTGEVDTGRSDAGSFAAYSFEYSTDGVNWTKASEDFLAGEQHADPSLDITGLKGATKYFVRLSAHNIDSTEEALSPEPNPEFETLPADPPAVLSIEDASSVQSTVAKVSGEVERPTPSNLDPGFDLQCDFEYVDDAQFLATGFADAAKTPCNPNPVTAADSPQVNAELTGLAPGTTYHLRLTVSNAGGTDSKVAANTFTTGLVPKPTVSLNPIGNLTPNSATFSAKIDPGAANSDPGFEVHWHFECQPACLGLSEESGSFGDDGIEHEVKTDASLEPNTAYTVKVVAENVGGSESEEVSFQTEAISPSALTVPAFVLEGAKSALVGGRIDANNSATTWWVEYGTSASYGQSLPASKDASAGSDHQLAFHTEELTGLSLGTTYHFRVSAKNVQGEVHGEDLTFTTPPLAGPPASCPNAALRTGPSASLPDCRAYENVTPMNLLGSKADAVPAAGPYAVGGFPTVAEDGDAALWRTTASLPGPDASGQIDTYLAKRTPSGWNSTLYSPPGSLSPWYPTLVRFTTPNLERSIWTTVDTVNPEDPDPSGPGFAHIDYYGREPDGSFVWLTRGSDMGPDPAFPNFGVGGASADALTFVFYDERRFEPDAPTGGLYIRSGQTTAVIKDENGVPIGVNPEVGGISADGSVIAVRNLEAVYVYRKSLGHAVLVANPYNNDGLTSLDVLGLSRDGSKLILASSEALTPDDDDSALDIYEYEVSTGDFKRLSGTSAGPGPGNGEASARPVLSGPDSKSVQPISPDGSAVYFTSTERLDGSKGANGVPNLYLAEGGTIRFVAALEGDGELQRPRFTREGEKLLFQSSDRLTAYNNNGHAEIYAYDPANARVVCASCRPSGEEPSGDATFGETDFKVFPGTIWGADESGDHIFFQSTDGVLPGDINDGKADVYEFDALSGVTSLISTGESPNSSIISGNSADGKDVFFFSVDSLRPHDQNVGVQKLFDARIGGGFPEPTPPAACEGEGCRSTSSAKPPESAPSTPNFVGPGNAKSKPKKHKAKKHRNRKHHKKHQSKSHKRAANSNGRTGQ